MSARAASTSPILVYSGGAPQRVLGSLLPEFERVTGCSVTATFQIVSEIQARLTAGDRPDLILLPEQLLAEVDAVAPLRNEGREVLARIGVGVIVREGAASPNLTNEAGVRSMLREAHAIALADPRTPSGQHLARMLAQLGLDGELQERLIYKGAIHGGGELVASGKADVGLYLLSEVQHIQGVRVAGLLPPSLQQHVVYVSGIPVSDRPPERAISLIRFLKAPENSAHWRDAGFEPVTPS